MPVGLLKNWQVIASTPAGLAWISSGRKWECATHLARLNKALVDIASGRIKRLMVFMPPRHGKSQLISEYFPAWYLGTHPSSRLILCSYGADFARTWGRKARDVLAAWGPELYGVEVRPDSKAANEWNIKRHTGGMSTAGIGGDITGKGARMLVIDDPIKNWQEATSKVIRDTHYDWYRSTAFTRLTADGRVILVCTRWNEDDLAGRLLATSRANGEQWEVINLPALAEDNDQLGRPPGAALWPEGGFTEDRLAQIKAEVGSQVWAALYQQRPSPAEGGKFRRVWFNQRYKDLPKLRLRVMGIDTGFKEGVDNDYTSIATWGASETDYYVIDVWRDKVAFPALIQAIKDQAAKNKPHIILIEDKGSGISAIQTLRNTTRLPIIAWQPKASKQGRADITTPAWEAMKVWLPEAAPWVGDFIEEHINFPNGAHDDQVDTSTMILIRLMGGDAEYIEDITDRQPDRDANIDIWDGLNNGDIF